MIAYPLCTESAAVETFTETLSKALDRAAVSIENKQAVMNEACYIEMLENLKNQNKSA